MLSYVVPIIGPTHKVPRLRYYIMQIGRGGQDKILARADSYLIILYANSEPAKTE